MTSLPLEQPNSTGSQSFVVGGVLLLHVAALWGVQHAMTSVPVKDVIEPAVIMTQLIAPPAPEPVAAPVAAPPVPEPPPPAPPPPPEPPPPPAPKPPPPKPQPKPVVKPKPVTEKTPVVPPPPAPVPAPPEPAPAPPAPVPPAPAPPAANITGAQQQSGTPTPTEGEPVIERATSNSSAALNNPQIPYPPISRRMREEGRVVLRVLVGANGTAKEVNIKTSSGHDRLDNVARETALRSWRFAPSKRNGIPVDDWYDIPVTFKIR